MRRWMVGLCVAVSLSATACGSTARNTQAEGGSQADLGDGTGLGPETGPLDSGSGGVSGLGAAAGQGTAAGSAAGISGGGGGSGRVPTGSNGAAAPGSSSAASAPVRARGVTASTIWIGVPYETGTEAAAKAFGVEGAGTVSAEDIVTAIVADVNKSGGVLGRKLAVHFHPFDTGQAIANPDTTVAEICSDYGDDRPVFAVVFSIPMPGLRQCLAEMGSPLILTSSIASIIPAASYAQYGGSFMYGITSITTERLAELFIESLHERSFHEKWNTTAGGPGVEPTKLGVIHVDTPDTNALYAAYSRELAKLGLKYDETATYPQNAQDALAATQGAVLQFKAAGVTHVYGASVFFLQAAESQNYRPRYAYLPGLGALGVANAPASQMRGAMTVGWAPVNDVNDAQDPGETASAKRCRDLMLKAGINTGNRQDRYLMYKLCDGVYSLREALVAGRTAGVAALRQGYESLGSRFAPATTFQARMGRNRHHGVDAVRDMAYDSECGCLVYTSRTNRS